MSDRIFVDTNILVYSISNDQTKRTIADSLLLKHDIVVSPQVINEFVAVTLRKKILPAQQVIAYATQFMQVFEVTSTSRHTIASALEVMTRYQFSYWDSLIVAAAVESLCPWLYTEDLQDGQKIENSLLVYNPFQRP